MLPARFGTNVLCALPALLVLHGCGDSGGTSSLERGRVERLTVEPLVAGSLDPLVVSHHEPGDEASPWTGRGDEPLPTTEVDGKTILRLAQDVAANIRIKSTHRSTDFDRVDATLKVAKGEETLIRITLFEGTRSALVSDVLPITGTGEYETIPIVLEGIERLDIPISEITFQMPANDVGVDFASVDVLNERPAALWPVPGDTAALLDVGGDGRRGWGLDSSLGAKLTLPDEWIDGQRLAFTYARTGVADGAKLELRGLAAETLSFDLGGVRGWICARLPLSKEDAGKELEFVVVDPEGKRVKTALAELHLEVPSSRDIIPPIVLLVTSDTHRGDHLSRGGTPGLVQTPTIDALGRRGVQFTNAFSSANMTNPSHVALMTGLSPRDTRIVGNRAPLAERATTIAEQFAEAGWATAALVSVQHIGHAYSGLGQGFDRYDGLERRADYRNGRREGLVAITKAQGWLRERDDVPLFLWVHVFDVHGPYVAPQEYEARYVGSADRGVPPERDPVPMTEPPAWIRDDASKRNEVHDAHDRYRAAVDHLDSLLDPLLNHRRVKKGWIAFTSDHGESFGRQNLWWTHHGMYVDQLHVPLIVAGPGVPEGVTYDHPVEMVMLGARLLELAGLDASVMPRPPLALDGTVPAEPRFALGYAGNKATIDHEGWFLVMNLVKHGYDKGPRKFPKGQVELFHIAEDPMCENELSADEPERAASMRQALIDWLDAADPGGLATTFNLNAEAEERLKALGYTGASESSRDGAWYVED